MGFRIAVIGGGNMGTAFVSGILGKGLMQPRELCVVEPDARRRGELSRQLGCEVFEAPCEAIRSSECLLLAVKPQIFPECADILAPYVDQTPLCVSLMAGVSLSTLQKNLPVVSSFVRAMPNLAARVCQGVTGYYVGSQLEPETESFLKEIFASVGFSLRLGSEQLVDACTALAGSGPGFLFAILEAFVKSGKEFGFTAKESEELVSYTVLGSLALWRTSSSSLSDLREQVTSKGGTTEAGLNVFLERDLDGSIREALTAAFRRAVELSGS
ncbi:MAG: pyrroline-5-carboxylate reductase [Bdellovibrionales bacterium]|nr:pyrroline-5-carboxylate reductase [Bdellovibrionales bacterium]